MNLTVFEKTQPGQISFEAYGVKILVETNEAARLARIENCINESLPYGFVRVLQKETAHFIEARHGENGRFEIFKDGEKVAAGAGDEVFYENLNSRIRLTIAEYAVGRVFLHAGVVGWKNRAVVIPARSFAGKTTLVAELLARGAVYYSDEYAVIDEKGRVHPFAKTLSMRGIVDDRTQTEIPAAFYGAPTGSAPLPVGMVLICRFDKGNGFADDKFDLEILSAGRGILEMLANTIPARRKPKLVLEILNKIAARAIIAKCRRGEAASFAGFLIDFLNRAF